MEHSWYQPKREDGRLLPVKIKSEKGKRCRLVNPWPGTKIGMESSLAGKRELEGNTVEFDTQAGEEIILREIG